MDFLDDFLKAISDTEVTTTSATFKLMLSLLLGGIVGFERKRKGQVAGARTFALISMGATLAMIVSIYIPQVYLGLKNGDPGRVAAQVITGVGFLGAGAIIQTKGSVRGLTTAAGIWMVAALGLAVGVGLYLVATISTILILFTLVSLEQYERRSHLDREGKIIHLRVNEIIEDLSQYETLLKEFRVSLHNVLVEYDYSRQTTDLKFIVLSRVTTNFVVLFSRMRTIYRTEYISLQNEI
ncbi:MAG TPA: MgtC/SapB family protein [Candidatus Barnesiella excrementigallinarum]|nr:MgtC/SapB family protein [Candidatus Barnesiella excrementigallinarum]